MNWLESLAEILFPPDSFGCLSLVPPFIAIGLAIITRHVYVSLLVGVFSGALILAHGNPFVATASTLETHLWTSLVDESHLRVFAFTLLMGAMVGVMRRSGGMEAIVNGIAPLARTRRGGQFTVWLLGMIVFFDDYANTLLLGNTMRPLTDRLRISREKLAYLVDSTAAPVSGLALVSTWVAGEVGFIQQGIDAAQLEGDAFAIFVESIPYRFYVLFALIFVPMVGLFGRDFGPMLRAERDLQTERDDQAHQAATTQYAASHWANAVFPVAAVVGVTVGLILFTGKRALAEKDSESHSFIEVFGAGDSYLSLVYGSLSGLVVGIILARLNAGVPWAAIRESAVRGAGQVTTALVILWLAWALSGMTGEKFLDTGGYLGELLKDAVAAAWLPTIVFVVSAIVAFSTGTSWGTMGIMMPLVIPTVVQILGAGSVDTDAPILIGSIGSVLAGAIFGDHCSPISDTTVLSSQASGCNHIAHVRTQLPYAMVVGVVSIVCGTLPIGFGVSPWLLLPIGVVVLIVALLLVGRSATVRAG